MTLLNRARATATPPLEPRDVALVAFSISSPLHYCTGTERCPDPPDCSMCSNAARLVMQNVIPMVAEEMLAKIEGTFGRACSLPHPSSD
jgi:hypothetical protein